MKLQTRINPPLPPDPVGDTLADCYIFLLRRLAEKVGTLAECSAEDTDFQVEYANASQEPKRDST